MGKMNANKEIREKDRVRILGHYPPIFGKVLDVKNLVPENLVRVDIPGWGEFWYGAGALKKA
jgi:hypothetical protein